MNADDVGLLTDRATFESRSWLGSKDKKLFATTLPLNDLIHKPRVRNIKVSSLREAAMTKTKTTSL